MLEWTQNNIVHITFDNDIRETLLLMYNHLRDIYYYRVCQKKKDILNIHIKSEGIKIFLQKFDYIEFTTFVVKCQKFTYTAQLFIG